MSAKNKIEQKIEKKKEEIIEHQSKIREAEVFIQAFQEALKVLPRVSPGLNGVPAIRENSIAWKAIKALRLNGRAMKINKLLEACGFPKEKKQSVSGTLAFYIRKGVVFTRPSPGTYGLVEFKAGTVALLDAGPPHSFGLDI